MTRKDYRAFADAIAQQRAMCRNEEQCQVVDGIASRLCSVFRADNINFDSQQFLSACDYQEPFNPNRRA